MELIDGDITLKQFTLADVEKLFQRIDKNREYLREWLPWVDDTKTVKDSKAFIQSTLENKNALHCGIWYKGELVGAIGFHYIHPTNKKAEIGYWLAADFQGKGIMTTACKMLIDYGFKKLDLHRIEISCAKKNMKSQAIPIRLGFTKEGLFRESGFVNGEFKDHEYYGLLVSEWME